MELHAAINHMSKEEREGIRNKMNAADDMEVDVEPASIVPILPNLAGESTPPTSAAQLFPDEMSDVEDDGIQHGDLITDVEVPGRTVILNQNKWDMGAHRFTWLDNNLVVAATDMPDYDDRQELKGEDKDQAAHYSKTLDRTTLYGYKKVYTDREIAHERVVFQIQSDQDVGPIA
ncbi:hypothetical protein QTG54_009943 [Skeletonema marinoi]|uniref:Uncharacterized protein n=1 Tax=Skeletonema marinoi TaxID=267567 RepID=A0AAD8Y6B5_9STRA|nr:hypothetical protein QTG54_009943 [Skeletonema marinoi]